MRFPKRGFHNSTRTEYACVNVDTLDKRFDMNAAIDPDALLEAGVLKGRIERVKILGRGELTKSLVVRAHGFTAEAKRKIEAAGGKAEVI